MENIRYEDQSPSSAGPSSNKLIGKLFLIVVFLLPLIFIPNTTFFLSKGVFAALAVFTLFALWLFSKSRGASYVIVRSITGPILLITSLFFIVSALFSANVSNALFGLTFEPGTVVSLLAALAFFTLAVSTVNSGQKNIRFYVALFFSALLVGIFQIYKIVEGADALNFGSLFGSFANLLGKINELGVFFGLIAILSMITLDYFATHLSQKVVFWSMFVFSLLFVVVIDLHEVVIVTGIFAALHGLVLFFGKSRKISWGAIALLVVSLAMLFFGTTIVGKLIKTYQPLSIQQAELIPTPTQTINIGIETLKNDPFLGSGPQSFLGQWLKYKTPEVNSDIFWSLDFSYGNALVPTFLTTVGPLGFLLVALIFLSFLFLGIKKMWQLRNIDTSSYFFVSSSFFAALYLIIFQVIYVPTHVLFYLTFVFMGIFIAQLIHLSAIKTKTLEGGERSIIRQYSLFAAGIATLLLIYTAWIGIPRVIASYYYQKAGALSADTSKISEIEALMKQAIKYDPRDAYYTTLTGVSLAKANQALTQATAEKKKPAEISAIVQPLFSEAVTYANQAINADPGNYLNYLNLAQIYSLGVTTGDKAVYAQANAAFQKALEYNPKNPAIVLSLARLEFTAGNTEKGKEYILKAIELKPNYVNALSDLYQLQASQNNTQEMIETLVKIVNAQPSDPVVHFELGYLLYKTQNYKEAAQVLERAVLIDGNFSNARYFLALSYFKLSRPSDAISQLEVVKQLNPDNKDVVTMISNLKAGRDPLARIPDPTPPTSITKTTPKKK